MMRKQMQNSWQCRNHMVGDISTEQFQGFKILLVYIFNSRFLWVQYIIDKGLSKRSLAAVCLFLQVTAYVRLILFDRDPCLKQQG